MSLHRYWVKFGFSMADPHPPGTLLGCGVTAHDQEDALMILRDRVFRGGTLPEVECVIEDVDMSTLDAKHVLPNMGNQFQRGVWFPLT